MINHIFKFRIFLRSFVIALIATIVSSCTYAHKPAHTLELKSGYFCFTQSPLSKVYSHGGFEESLSASFPVWKWLNVYTSVGIAYVKGKALNSCQKTSLLDIPVDLGLKVVFPLHTKLDYYLSFGGRYSYLQQHNDSLFIDRHVHQHCGGLFVNTGFNIFVTNHWLVGLFGEYAYGKTSINPKKCNVFGECNLRIDNAAVGLSIGYSF